MKNWPCFLWIAGFALSAACSDGGGEESGPPQTKPAIVWAPETPSAGESVQFSLSGNVSNIRSILWMFGDGKTAAGAQVSHAYIEAGDYTVKAAVTPVEGSMTELSQPISVNATEAGMVVSNDFPARMEPVVLSLNRIADVSGVVWDFGDGSERAETSSATEELTHSYAEDGSYTVRAEVSYTNGKTETLRHEIKAEGPSLSWSCRNFDRSKMWIMAHRGNTKNGYELPPNSLAAFRRCVELGCVEFIETDVQITKDGEVICLHDNYLSRFTDYNNYASGKGMVADFTLEELGRFRLKTTDGKVSDQKIPTLEEVLLEFRGKIWFNLDKCMENDVNIEKVYDVVKRCGCLDRVQFYISSSTDRADWLSRQKPQGIIAPHANKDAVLTQMAAYSPVYMIQTSTAYVNASWISSVNAKALSVSNLLDDEGQAFYNGNTTLMDSFVTAGVRMIQCDYPAEMNEYLRSKGKR